VWVDHEVQYLSLDFLLGTMELDGRGVRIDHDQPLRTFLNALPNTVPCEDPDFCARLDYDDETLRGEVDGRHRDDGAEELPRPSPPRPAAGSASPSSPDATTPPGLLPPPMPPVPPATEPIK
jgi:hypothetical protein